MSRLKLFYGAALVDEAKLGNYEEVLSEVSGDLLIGASEGKDGYGWVDLPEKGHEQIIKVAEALKSFDSLIHIGIGGSALGNKMLFDCLTHPFYNELSREERKGPRFYLLDNSDPHLFLSVLDMVDLSRTGFIVVSKSGTTAETMANFLALWEKLKENKLPNLAQRIVVITDPNRGALRKFANEIGCLTLEVPQNVGGRFSVLSPVGLLSAAVQGVAIEELLHGAKDMKKKLFERNSIDNNPAWILAALSMENCLAGRNMLVFMPYLSRMNSFTEWFAQLWAESLGKDGKGITPIRAIGAIDQHSQVQLYTSGPNDKLFLILTEEKSKRNVFFPEKLEEDSLNSLSYLLGKDMKSMLNCEAQGTLAALAKSGKPVAWMEMPNLDAYHLGGLIYFFEYLTAITGGLMKVNPFDQPGVEQGKVYTRALLGKEGAETEKKEAESYMRHIRSLASVI